MAVPEQSTSLRPSGCRACVLEVTAVPQILNRPGDYYDFIPIRASGMDLLPSGDVTVPGVGSALRIPPRAAPCCGLP